ncbi:phage tail protein [Cloacibacillus evryensis]|uniref:phage tail protein n=1 Tax=Cloacibacillus evryensis TaxID=508460 RepID=UPI0005546AD6|nr:phage tail protein [Cloacibacillus evryensis]
MPTPVFTWIPDFTWQPQFRRRVNITTFESGKEQRSDRGAAPREWALTFTGRAETLAEIEAFWNARKGPVESFLWTPPGAASSITVRFKDDTLKSDRAGMRHGKIELTLREIL